MTLTTVILLVVLGILIILAEIFFVPGTSFVGAIGIIISAIGIWAAFYYLGNTTGFIVFGCTVAIVGIMGFLAFRAGTWKVFEVKGSIDGKATNTTILIQPGDKGVTVTRCSPIGKAEIGGEIEEVYSEGDYLEAGVSIVVTQVKENKIYIQTLIV